MPNVKRLLDEINARPAAQRAEALKARYTFKSDMVEGHAQGTVPAKLTADCFVAAVMNR